MERAWLLRPTLEPRSWDVGGAHQPR